MIPIATAAVLAVAAFVLGWIVRDFSHRKRERLHTMVAREIREHADRGIVATLSERAERLRDAEEQKRALLYRRRVTDVDPMRDTSRDLDAG